MLQTIQTFLHTIHDAIMNKQWWIVAAMLLMLTVQGLKWLVPKLNGKLGAWFQTDHGAITLVLITSFAGALATAFGGGSAPTWSEVVRALQIGATSAIAYPTVRKWITGMLAHIGINFNVDALAPTEEQKPPAQVVPPDAPTPPAPPLPPAA